MTAIASTISQRPSLGLLAACQRLFRPRVLVLVLAVLTWEGLVASLIGGNVSQQRQLLTIVIGILSAWRLVVGLYNKKFHPMEMISFFLFSYCVFVTVVSNAWIFPSGQQNWLLSVYAVIPVLFLPALRVANFKSNDIIDALLVVGVFASMLVVADQFARFPWMEAFSRGESEWSGRKVVLLKTESACAFVIAFIRFSESRSLLYRMTYAAVLAVSSLNLFLVTESRLALTAVALSVAITLVFLFRGRIRTRTVVWILVAGVLFGPFLLGNFLDRFLEFFFSDQYAQSDAGLWWRIQTSNYFYGYYEQTGGIGFGLMSTNVESNNLISWGLHFAGLSYGIGNYWMNIADTGLWSALTQFGIVGLILVCSMTGWMAWTLLSYGRRFADLHETFALGALVLAYMISPLPMNFFTLEWTAMAGNLLWALAALVSLEKLSPTPTPAVLLPNAHTPMQSNRQ